MRWVQPKHGDVRIVKRFLLFPRCVNGECRWLEIVQIRQQFYHSHRFPYSHGWDDIAWVDEEEEI